MTTTHIIATLNKAWAAVQRNHHELPDVMIVTGRRRHKSEGNIRGQHCRDTWHTEYKQDKKASEVWVAGEQLAEGGAAVMQTLLHEAAHELARVRELKDTSNKNRYHNKTFVKIAEELGLEGPESSGGPALGYSNCAITRATTEIYSYEIKELDEACKSFVVPPPPEPPKEKKASIKAYCPCPDDNYVTWTKKLQKRREQFDVFPLMCAICRQTFEPEDTEES